MDKSVAPLPSATGTHRRSIRLPDYDYAQEGMYYVTICTADRSPLLGNLVYERIELSDIGRIVSNEWCRTPLVRPNVTLLDLVIMPDHLHAILTITERRGVSHTPAPQRLRSPYQTLGAIVRGFKADSTKQIHALRKSPDAKFWQRNYNEHIVRDERDLAEIRQYIRYNPLRLSVQMKSVAEPDKGVCNTPLHIRRKVMQGRQE